MRINLSKKVIIPSISALALLGGGIVFALQSNNNISPYVAPPEEIRENVKVKNDDQHLAQAAIPETETVVVQSEANEQEPQNQPTIEYGVDPSTPGRYIVFDKQKVLDEAAISANDQAVVDSLVNKLSNWAYKLDVSDKMTICGTVVRKTEMAKFGDDYETNPITQLKWCGWYVKNRYGSWQQANIFHGQNGWI